MKYRQIAFSLGLFSLIIAASADSAWAQRRGDCRNPVLYEDDDFRGGSLFLEGSVSDLNNRGFGDDASSVCVPRGWRVILYEDTNFRGDSLQLTGPDSIFDLKRDRPGGRDWGDRISSAQVYPPRRRGGGNPPPQCDRTALLFGNDDFGGRRVTLNDSIPDLHRLGVGDQASSLCVPPGWRITVYENTGFRGDRLLVEGPDSIADLKRDRPGGRSWGDRISSVRVESSSRRDRPVDRDRRPVDPCDRYPRLFAEDDFRGRSYTLRGSAPDLHDFRLGHNASSLCVPSGWTVTFYDDDDYRGRSFQVRGPQTIDDLRRTRWGNWNDRISSARIGIGVGRREPDPVLDPGPGRTPCDRYPILYRNDDFRGRPLELRQSITNLHRQGLGDSASSICVPRGWEVTLYEDTNYRGDSLRVVGPDSISDLDRERRRGGDWGDEASSVQVRRR